MTFRIDNEPDPIRGPVSFEDLERSWWDDTRDVIVEQAKYLGAFLFVAAVVCVAVLFWYWAFTTVGGWIR